MLIKFIAAAIEGVACSEYERENTKAQPMLFVESRDPRKKKKKKERNEPTHSMHLPPVSQARGFSLDNII